MLGYHCLSLFAEMTVLQKKVQQMLLGSLYIPDVRSSSPLLVANCNIFNSTIKMLCSPYKKSLYACIIS